MTPSIAEIKELIELMKTERVFKLQTSQITLELDSAAFYPITTTADVPKESPENPTMPSDDDLLFYSTPFYKGKSPETVEEPADG